MTIKTDIFVINNFYRICYELRPKLCNNCLNAISCKSNNEI